LNDTYLQTMTGPLNLTYLEATGTVPYAGGNMAAIGYGQLSGETDYYAGTNSGATGPAHSWFTPNSGAWLQLMTLDNSGDLFITGDITLSTGGQCLQFPISTQTICDDQSAGGIAYAAGTSSTYGHRFYEGSTLLWQMDPLGNFTNANGIIIPAAATGYTGTGNNVMSSGPTMTDPIVGTQTVSDNSTKAASTAFVSNAIVAVSSGVVSINGYGGAYTFTGGGVSCVTTTCTFNSTGITGTHLALPTGIVVPANTCYGAGNTTTPSTFVMTGVTTSPQSNVWAGWQGNPHLTNGWGSIGGLQLDLWVSASNTVSYVICNPTAASIASGTPTFIISAQ
jgi:hypothetical protein